MLIFVSIFGVGFGMLVLSVIFGHDFDADVDLDVDVDTDVGGGPSVFSLKIISLLMVGFGGAGFAARVSSEASMFMSSMYGIGGALVMGIIGYLILRIFYASQASSTISRNDLIGQKADLIDAIPEGGQGQVACLVRGREITFLARSEDGNAIAKGVPVRIVRKVGNSVIVEKAN